MLNVYYIPSHACVSSVSCAHTLTRCSVPPGHNLWFFFCNSGYDGVDCTKAGTGGAVFVEAPPLQHQLASPDLSYPPVPGNSSSEEAYLYCYTLCASDGEFYVCLLLMYKYLYVVLSESCSQRSLDSLPLIIF